MPRCRRLTRSTLGDQNVYRDLRDRRLLSIAIVLVVAIVAVPFLIKGEGDPRSRRQLAGDAAASVAGRARSSTPVVLTEQPVLRDFRERLDRYRTQNPFKQQLTAVPSARPGRPQRGRRRLDRRRRPAPTSRRSTPPPTPAPTDAGTEPEEPIDPDSTAPDGDDGRRLGRHHAGHDPGRRPDRHRRRHEGDQGRQAARLPAGPAGRRCVEYLQSDFELTEAVFIVSPFVTSQRGRRQVRPEARPTASSSSSRSARSTASSTTASATG